MFKSLNCHRLHRQTTPLSHQLHTAKLRFFPQHGAWYGWGKSLYHQDISIYQSNLSFNEEEYYDKELNNYSNPIVVFIKEKVDYCFDYNLDHYGINETYSCDLTAASYLMRPDLFKDDS